MLDKANGVPDSDRMKTFDFISNARLLSRFFLLSLLLRPAHS